MTEENQKPGYKQAWPWFVISIPLLTVVAGIITFMIAAEKPHSMVQDDYFKKGLAINQSLAKQENAKNLGLNATVDMESDAGLLTVKFAGSTIPAKQIKLIFLKEWPENLCHKRARSRPNLLPYFVANTFQQFHPYNLLMDAHCV